MMFRNPPEKPTPWDAARWFGRRVVSWAVLVVVVWLVITFAQERWTGVTSKLFLAGFLVLVAWAMGAALGLIFIYEPRTRRDAESGLAKSNLAQLASAAGAVITAAAACVGVFAFFHSIEIEKATAADQAIARLYPLDNEAQVLIAGHPRVRACFRDDPGGDRFKALSDGEKQTFTSACAIFANVFEYYLLNRSNIRNHANGYQVIEAWDAYFRVFCQRSYGFRQYIEDRPQVWTRDFLDAFAQNTKD